MHEPERVEDENEGRILTDTFSSTPGAASPGQSRGGFTEISTNTDEDIDKMHGLFARIFTEEYPVEDVSAADWLAQQVRACTRYQSPHVDGIHAAPSHSVMMHRESGACKWLLYCSQDYGCTHMAQGATPKMLAAADACYANDYGRVGSTPLC